MKIFFIGSVEFSEKMLIFLLETGAEIIGAGIKKKSSVNSDFADLTPICIKYKIPFRFIEDINSPDTISWIQSLKPYVVFCFGWSNLLKNEILKIATYGVIGYHPAALPENRSQKQGRKNNACLKLLDGFGVGLSRNFVRIIYSTGVSPEGSWI